MLDFKAFVTASILHLTYVQQNVPITAAQPAFDFGTQLAQIAQIAMAPIPKDIDFLASQALSVFGQQAAQTSALPALSFVNLLTVLGLGGLWEIAFAVYRTAAVAVSLFFSSCKLALPCMPSSSV